MGSLRSGPAAARYFAEKALSSGCPLFLRCLHAQGGELLLDAQVVQRMDVASDDRHHRPHHGAVGRARRHLDRIAQLFLDGAVRAPEITLFPLSKGGDALSMSEGRHFRGKIVLQVR